MDGRIALPKGYRAWECSSGGASGGEVRFPLRQQRGGCGVATCFDVMAPRFKRVSVCVGAWVTCAACVR